MAKLLFELIDISQEFRDTVKMEDKIYAANEIVLKEDVEHNTIFLIKKGSVRVVQTTTTEDDHTIHPAIQELHDGEYFGEFCLFGKLPATADVVTNTECEVIEIDKFTCLEYLEKHPDVGYELSKQMIEELIKKLLKANKAMKRFLVWGLKKHGIDEHL